MIPIDGKEWPTATHYYQASKFPARPDLQEQIRKLPTAAEAYQSSRTYAQFQRPDWEQGSA